MTAQFVLGFGHDALMLLLMIALPALGAVMVVGLIVSIFQAVTQVHEATLSFVPKLVAAVLVYSVKAILAARRNPQRSDRETEYVALTPAQMADL